MNKTREDRQTLKNISREFPDAAFELEIFSGSFDCAPVSFQRKKIFAALRSG
jgi:hypothetical protein